MSALKAPKLRRPVERSEVIVLKSNDDQATPRPMDISLETVSEEDASLFTPLKDLEAGIQQHTIESYANN